MQRDTAEAEKSFLHDDQDRRSLSDHQCLKHSRIRGVPHVLIILTFGMVTAISLAVNFWFLSRLNVARHQSILQNSYSLHIPFSPAHASVSYEVRGIEVHDPDDPFNSPPSERFDRAWQELLNATDVKVYPDELRKAGKKSLRVHDSEEVYVGYLEVYHQLHCLKRLVQARWPEKYPRLVAKGDFNEGHYNHCIQVLRKGIMCSGDAAINTFEFQEDNVSWRGVSNAPRKCVNWDRLSGWAQSRAIPYASTFGVDDKGWFGPD